MADSSPESTSGWARWLEQRLGLRPEQFRRLAHFLLLGLSLVTVNVLAITVAEALFLSNAGPERLPLVYVLIAVVSIPLATGFSQLVDRLPRIQLFRYLLLGAMTLVLVLRVLLGWEVSVTYYALYLGFLVVELLLDIQYWVLVSDYFTSLELKRYAPLLVMAMALGGLLGGGLAGYLSAHISTENLLLVVLPLFGVGLVQLTILDRSQKGGAAEKEEDEGAGGLLENLKIFPQLMRRYSIIIFIAGSGLLAVVLQRIIEFQVFTIYSHTFPNEQDLTTFLGTLHAILSVVEFGITYFFTRPLIQRLGVSRMNMVYPASLLACFGWLGASFHLPAAVAGSVTYDTLAASVASPVETLNYNAVPKRFRGRVRVLNDAFFYPGGVALAGGLLLICQRFFSPFQITLMGLVLGIVYLGVGYLMGNSYSHSLIEILRSRSVNLDDVSEGLQHLPTRYAGEVRQLLTSDDPGSLLLGLELASRMDPTQFLDQVQALLPKADSRIRGSLVKFYCAFRHGDMLRHLHGLLESENPIERGMALEAFVSSREPLSDEQLLKLLQDSSPEVRALACVAVRQAGSTGPEVVAASGEALQAGLESSARQAVIRAIRNSGERHLVPWLPLYQDILRKMLQEGDPTVRREALEAMALIAHPSEPGLEELATAELSHPDAQVRAAAYQLLSIVRTSSALQRVAAGLEDGNQVVRESAAASLAGYSERALPAAEKFLHSTRPEVVDASITAIGRVGTSQAEELLFKLLQISYRQVHDNLRWLRELPQKEFRWEPLRIALLDSNQRTIDRVLHVLTALGDGRTLNCVRRILHSPDERMRADAVETLGSLPHRRFVEPILPLLELGAGHVSPAPSASGPRRRARSGEQRLLQEGLRASDRWVRLASLAVLAACQYPIPAEALQNDPDPLVRLGLLHTLMRKAYLDPAKAGRAAQGGSDGRSAAEYGFMNRVLFLKNISLFQYLTLEHLLIIDQLLDQRDYLAGETIFNQDSFGTNFCIVFRGSVMIRRRYGENEEELARLSPGEFFGEMALFDDTPRSATALAETDCTLLALDRSHFHSLIVQRPEIALELCKVMSLRLRKANERLGWWRWRVTWPEGPQQQGVDPKRGE